MKLLNNEEMNIFCQQMAMILNAGITPYEGILDMLDDTVSKEGREVLQKILDKSEEGASFYDSVLASEVFPKYALDMINIGEKSGNLEEVMRLLAFHYRREENIKKGIKSAVTYPFLIVLMMLVVIIVLIVKVLPVFNKVFIQLGSNMAGASEIMLNVGLTISKYSMFFVGLIILAIGIYLYFTMSKEGIANRSKIFSRVKITKGIYEKIAAGRFAAGMSLALNAGLDTDEGLEMIKELVDNPVFYDKIETCKEMMSEGLTFHEALSVSEIFPSKYARMVSVGYKTGAQEDALEKIAEAYELEVDDTMNRMISIIEPTLVIILSIVVCLILLSVMLPLTGIMIELG